MSSLRDQKTFAILIANHQSKSCWNSSNFFFVSVLLITAFLLHNPLEKFMFQHLIILVFLNAYHASLLNSISFCSMLPLESLSSLIFNFKPKFSPVDSTGMIFKRSCKNHGCVYVEQVARKLVDRIIEHKEQVNLEICFPKSFNMPLILMTRENFLIVKF